MSVPNIVTIRELSKEYRQGEINVTALNNVSLDIAPGEFLTLMGPSGSGKSTLAKTRHAPTVLVRPCTSRWHGSRPSESPSRFRRSRRTAISPGRPGRIAP